MISNDGWGSRHGFWRARCASCIATIASLSILTNDTAAAATAQSSGLTPSFFLLAFSVALVGSVVTAGLFALVEWLRAPTREMSIEWPSGSDAVWISPAVALTAIEALRASIGAAESMGFTVLRVEQDRFRALSRPSLATFRESLTVWAMPGASDMDVAIYVEVKRLFPTIGGRSRRIRRANEFLVQVSALLSRPYLEYL